MINIHKGEKILLIALGILFLAGLGISAYKKMYGDVGLCVCSQEQEFFRNDADSIIEAHEYININSSDARELTRLFGIGPVLAQSIVDYTKKHGVFTSKEDLLKVKGIGPSIFEHIKDSIVLE